MKPVKQVIVMRKDLKMRRGKEIAQGAHASQAWLLDLAKDGGSMTKEEKAWVENGHTKVCVKVDSEEELQAIFSAARLCGLTCHMITDAGRTEFNGVPTWTCLAIGPNYSDEIDKITGHLVLY